MTKVITILGFFGY